MNKSLVRRLERLEQRPVSGEVLHRVRDEWRRTGVVPAAPAPALRLVCGMEAGVAELEAYVPRPGDADAEERRREMFLNYAGELREMQRDPRAMVGHQFVLHRDGEGGLGPGTWPWEDDYDE